MTEIGPRQSVVELVLGRIKFVLDFLVMRSGPYPDIPKELLRGQSRKSITLAVSLPKEPKNYSSPPTY